MTRRFLVLSAAFFALAGRAAAVPLASPWDAPRYLDQGPLQYFGSLETLYQWDSNIQRQASDGRSDHLGIARAAVAGRVTGPEDSYLSALYQGEGERFLHAVDLNTLNHLVDVRGKLGARRGYLTASEQYLRTNDRTNTVFAKRERREENTARAGVGAVLDDVKAELNGELFKRIYQDPVLPGYHSGALEPRLIWDRDERNRGELTARWERLFYPDNTSRDGDVYEGRGSWSFAAPGSGVWLSGNAGIQRRVYRGPDVNGYFGPVAEGNARYVPRDRIALTARYVLSAEEAPLEPPSAYYRQHEIDLGVEHKADDRLLLRLSQAFFFQRYGDNTQQPDFSGQRRDFVARSALGATYRLQEHVSFVGDLSWERRGSNARSQEYRGVIVSFGCKLEV